MAPLNPYQRASSITASPLEQVAILLDRTAAHVKAARLAIDKKNIEERFLATESATRIITGLSSVFDKGKAEVQDFVQGMERFFLNILYQLTQVNTKNDAILCNKIETNLKDMASIWRLANAGKAQVSK